MISFTKQNVLSVTRKGGSNHPMYTFLTSEIEVSETLARVVIDSMYMSLGTIPITVHDTGGFDNCKDVKTPNDCYNLHILVDPKVVCLEGVTEQGQAMIET